MALSLDGLYPDIVDQIGLEYHGASYGYRRQNV